MGMIARHALHAESNCACESSLERFELCHGPMRNIQACVAGIRRRGSFAARLRFLARVGAALPRRCTARRIRAMAFLYRKPGRSADRSSRPLLEVGAGRRWIGAGSARWPTLHVWSFGARRAARVASGATWPRGLRTCRARRSVLHRGSMGALRRRVFGKFTRNVLALRK